MTLYIPKEQVSVLTIALDEAGVGREVDV